jgi:hypothetical protein
VFCSFSVAMETPFSVIAVDLYGWGIDNWRKIGATAVASTILRMQCDDPRETVLSNLFNAG